MVIANLIRSLGGGGGGGGVITTALVTCTKVVSDRSNTQFSPFSAGAEATESGMGETADLHHWNIGHHRSSRHRSMERDPSQNREPFQPQWTWLSRPSLPGQSDAGAGGTRCDGRRGGGGGRCRVQ